MYFSVFFFMQFIYRHVNIFKNKIGIIPFSIFLLFLTNAISTSPSSLYFILEKSSWSLFLEGHTHLRLLNALQDSAIWCLSWINAFDGLYWGDLEEKNIKTALLNFFLLFLYSLSDPHLAKEKKKKNHF